MSAYEHNQWGAIPIVVAVVIFLFAGAVVDVSQQPAAAVLLIAAGVLIAFARLATRVDETGVSWAFTAGVPRGYIGFNEIYRMERVRTSLIEGWGIHWTWWHGWLWNVGGFDAVQFLLKNGKSITLGTNDAEGLYKAVLSRLTVV